MDETQNGLFPDTITSEQLDDEAWLRAIQHAESYGIYPMSDLSDATQEELDALDEEGSLDDYSDNIEGWWEDYDAEKHDMLSTGSGWDWQ
jgi:hypothetical protein